MIAYGLHYSHISEIIALIMRMFSIKFEYQADVYNQNTYKGKPLITSLKKLSKNSLNKLTPHPTYAFVHYSNPTLLDRIENSRKLQTSPRRK